MSVYTPIIKERGGVTLLMQEVFKYIRKNTFCSVNLFYDTNNKGLDDFYRQFGFEIIPNAMRLQK